MIALALSVLFNIVVIVKNLKGSSPGGDNLRLGLGFLPVLVGIIPIIYFAVAFPDKADFDPEKFYYKKSDDTGSIDRAPSAGWYVFHSNYLKKRRFVIIIYLFINKIIVIYLTNMYIFLNMYILFPFRYLLIGAVITGISAALAAK